MRLLDVSPRKVLLSLSLALVSIAGLHCAQPVQTPIELDRASRSASIHLRSSALTDQDRLHIRGTVLDHSTTEIGRYKGGLVQLQEEGTGTIYSLRYRLPGEEQLPVQSEQVLAVFAEKTPPHEKGRRTFWSLVILAGNQLLFAHIQQNIVPPGLPELPLQVRGNGAIAYRESGRIQGLCEGVLAERELKLSWQGRNYTMSPGEEIEIEASQGPDERSLKLTLVQNNDLVEGKCSLDPPFRSELVILPLLP